MKVLHLTLPSGKKTYLNWENIVGWQQYDSGGSIIAVVGSTEPLLVQELPEDIYNQLFSTY